MFLLLVLMMQTITFVDSEGASHDLGEYADIDINLIQVRNVGDTWEDGCLADSAIFADTIAIDREVERELHFPLVEESGTAFVQNFDNIPADRVRDDQLLLLGMFALGAIIGCLVGLKCMQ